MKQNLMQLHKELVNKGFYNAARLVLRLIVNKSIVINDSNNEAYESGMAQWMQDNCRYSNGRYSMNVYFRG